LLRYLLATGKLICKVTEGTAADVDVAVKAAQKAMDTTWGLNCPGSERSRLLTKLAILMEEHIDKIASLEALDNGQLPIFYASLYGVADIS
jgi:aldehyde dehydrogenase (NAD+)